MPRLCLLLALLLSACAEAQLDSSHPDRWEQAIQAFEETGRNNPPPEGGIVFTGSSSVRRWDLQQSFPDLPVINRGFGGSELSHSISYVYRILTPLHPRTIVLYAGDNDIGRGKSADRVVDDFQQFTAVVREAMPQTRIVFIAIKPSLSRWNLIRPMRDANSRIQALTQADDLLDFADIDTPMMGPDAKPRPELFLDDGLHLTEEGYRVWTKVIRPLIADGS